jgi:putative transposase
MEGVTQPICEECPISYTTLWTIDDELWAYLAPVLPADKAPGTVGRPAIPNRRALDGVLFVLRTGCQWKALKTEWFGASSSLHSRYQSWRAQGVFEKIFRRLLVYYHQRRGIQWRWQAIDSKAVPAPLGGEQTGKNPTDRGKLGSQRHMLVDARGAPLAIVVSPANAHDKTCAAQLLDALLIPRPPTIYRVHHLCADKGYDYADVRAAAHERHYRVHIAKRGVQLTDVPATQRHPARRWVVERTLSWQNDFRSLRTRWAKYADNWLAFIQLASALVLWQMAT